MAFFLPVKDTDFGWHYRCGEEFITQGKLCLQNEFAYFLPNYKWANPNFIYDISLALFYDHFGFVGVSVLGSIVFAAFFLLFFAILKGPYLFRITAIFLTAVLSSNMLFLGYRSQILGLLFVLIEFLILKGPSLPRSVLYKDGPFKTFKIMILAALFLLWSNSHPSFFLGPLILAFYTIEKMVNVYLDKNNSDQSKMRRFIFCSAFFLVPSLTTLVNSFGWRVYQMVLQHFQSPLDQMIAEWVAPDWWQVVLIITITITVIGLVAIKRMPLDFRLPLLLVFAYFAISARRNLPLYYIIVFWHLSELSISSITAERTKQIIRLVSLIIIIVGIPIFALQIAKTIAFDSSYSSYCQNGQVKLPCQAIEKLKDKPGNLFNMYEQGGFLVWKLPQMKVFVDGRMPAWKDENGKSPYQVYLEIIQAQPGWNESLRKYKTDYLLINNGTFLDLLLQEKGSQSFGWQQDYRDQLSVIYRKID